MWTGPTGAAREDLQIMDIVTRLHLHFKTRFIGTDEFGNRYYEERKARPGKPPRRYIRYKGMVEASKVPADWHGWLHHTEDNPPPEGGYRRHEWQQDQRDHLHIIHQPAVSYYFGKGHAHGWVDMKHSEKSADLELHCIDPKHTQHGDRIQIVLKG